MKRSVLLALLLVIVLPASLFVGSAIKMHADSRMVLAQRLEDARRQALDQVEAGLTAQLQRLATEMDRQLAELEPEVTAIRSLVRSTPQVRQALHMGTRGERLFPPRDQATTEQEREFIDRTAELWRNRGIQYPPAAEGQIPDRGWYTWYWGEEMKLIRWLRRDDGSLLGVELESARLISDLINAISGAAPHQARLRIRNERGEVVYQWPAVADETVLETTAIRPMRAPLASWRIEYAEPALGPDSTAPVWLLAVVATAVLLMVALAGYLYRAQRREMQIAGQRVSFVNQVSHELKTPLTNLRMYGELLERELGEDDERSKRYLAVILSESERLSRLINNVLSFARSERSTLEINPRIADINDVVRQVLETFDPALQQAGIQVELQLSEHQQSRIDVDAIGQILNNLISNVEKYAADGGLLALQVSREADMLCVRVSDAGTGIPPEQAAHIFDAFYRVDDSLNGQAAGTGIGLSVARELARLHGGDLVLEPAGRGASFLLTLYAPLLVEPDS